jgi:NAD(P)-dependent dehydrogenase (short-subunit alcohol dehydrogenase family)
MTGCSQGLGYELSKAVLAAGQKLVASSRTPSTTAETVAGIERLGGRWVTLDVALPQLDDRVHAALVAYGRVDVLVHNAGISIGGAVEDFRSDFQAHLWYPVPRPRVLPRPTWHKLVLCSKPTSSTPLRLIQLLTPHMRAPKSGTIINISGGSTWRAMPGIILYAASKAAINGSFSVSIPRYIGAISIVL